MPVPPPPRDHPSEAREGRDALMTFAPAILVAFVLNWALVARAGWPERRALGASVVFGIVLALVLQRVIARRGRE
jgi:hypothetical protein